MELCDDAVREALRTYMRLSFNDDGTQKTVVVFDVMKQVIETYLKHADTITLTREEMREMAEQALASYRAEPTEDEIEAVAEEIWHYAQGECEYTVDPTRSECIGLAKAAIEAFLNKRG